MDLLEYAIFILENFYMKYVSGKLGISFSLYQKIFRKVQKYMEEVQARKEREEMEKTMTETEKNSGLIHRFVNSIIN